MNPRDHGKLSHLRGEFVSVAGQLAAYTIENHSDPEEIDHIWIDLRADPFGVVRISLSTLSRKNRDAGFDARIRLGILSSTWRELPEPGIRKSEPLDYSVVEAASAISYREIDQQELQELIIDKLKRAHIIQCWGELYLRNHVGVHQVHSRRASSAVPMDYVGRDGALQLFFQQEKHGEMLLFKFSGQP